MTHQLFFWGKDLGIKFATIGREINPKGPGTKTQGLMTLTRQPVVQPFWMGAYKQDSSANKWSCPEAHLRRKNFAEKLEHPLGGSARPREPPLSNAARYYHYNRAPMRWSISRIVVPNAELPSRRVHTIHGIILPSLSSSFCKRTFLRSYMKRYVLTRNRIVFWVR